MVTVIELGRVLINFWNLLLRHFLWALRRTITNPVGPYSNQVPFEHKYMILVSL